MSALGSVLDTVEVVAGVVLALAGLMTAAMGLVAVAARTTWRRGAIGTAAGLAAAALGLWLVGIFPGAT